MIVFILTHTVVCEWSDAFVAAYSTKEKAEAKRAQLMREKALPELTEDQKDKCLWSGEWYDIREVAVDSE